MKIRVGELRRLVREAMKHPSGMQGLALFVPDDAMFVLYAPSDLKKELRFHASRKIMAPERSATFAFTSCVVAALELEPFGSDSLRVSHVWSSERGYGSFLYDVAMKLTGKSLVRGEKTSSSAMNVWNKYAGRSDVVVSGDDDTLQVTPGPGFRTDFNLEDLLTAHQDCMDFLLKSAEVVGMLSSALGKDVLTQDDIEKFFKRKCSSLLVDAVKTGY